MSDGDSAVQDADEMWDELSLDQDLTRMLDHPEADSHNGTLRKSEEYAGFDDNVGDTWIYPSNLPCRAYQLSISKSALYQNTLVVLPTGLGKTFIAAVVMYNIYRWYPRGKVIFMAPTRPLVAQQINACRRIMPFPDKDTVELTGHVPRARRIELWRRKRVFFATPHVVRSDIVGPDSHDSDGVAALDGFEFPYDAIKLIVVDEAHKAKGRYAYTEVAQSIFQRNPNFRVLALSATPGRTSDDVAEVVRNLFISHLEVRFEKSVDVMSYVHKRTMKTIVVRLTAEIKSVREELLQIIDPYVRQLIDAEVLSGSLGNLNRNFLLYEQKRFRERSQRHPQQSSIASNFSICISLYHSLELLERHGMRIFLNNFEEDDEGRPKFVVALDGRLRDLIARVREDVGPNPFNVSAANMTNGLVAEMPTDLDFGHPKFEEARSCLLQHFESHPDTRAIVFCEYRESVMLIYRLLLQHKPLLRPRCFVGQGGTTGSLRALTQKQQIQTMADFRTGKSNILVATSIGEEGIDVGEVELIVCFDISTSNPTRFVQRIGRTGRQRKGNVVMIVTEGREHQLLQDVLRQKDKINMKLLQSHVVKEALYRHAPRLVPVEYNPECVRLFIKEPSEEVEEQTATKRRGRVPKATKEKIQKTIKEDVPKASDNKRDAMIKCSQAFRQYFSTREKTDFFDFAEPSSTQPPPPKMDDCTTSEPAPIRHNEVQQEPQPVIGELAKTTPSPPPPLLRNVNKQLSHKGPILPATISSSAILTQLRSKVLTREAKLFFLRMNTPFVRDACENMMVLDALDIDEAQMTAEEQTIRRTHEQIVKVFGSLQELYAFIEQVDNEDNTRKCRERIKFFEDANGFSAAQLEPHFKKIFDDSCKQVDFKCDRHDYIEQRLVQTQRYSVETALGNEEEHQPSMVYDWNEKEKPSDSELNISTSVFDTSKFVDSPRPPNRQSTPRAGPSARAFKRQCDRGSQPSIAQLFARVDDNNTPKKAAGNEDDVVVILDCEEPSTFASKEHQIVDEQFDEDFPLMEMEDCDPQMEGRENENNTPKKTAGNEDDEVVILDCEEPSTFASKEHQIVDEQFDEDFPLMELEDCDPQMKGQENENNRPKKTAGNEDDVVVILDCEEPSTFASKEHQIVDEQFDEDFPLMEMEDWEPEVEGREEQPQLEKQPQTTDQSQIKEEKVAPTPLAVEIYNGQKPQEEPKRFFSCSSKENIDRNNVMRTCAVRQSPDIFSPNESMVKTPGAASKLSLAGKLAAKVGMNSNQKTEIVATSPSAVPDRQNTLQPHASTSTTTSPSVCDRYLKKLKVRGTPGLPGVSSSTPLQAVDSAAEQTTTMAELSLIGAGLRKKSTKRRIFDDEEDEEDDEEMLNLTNNEKNDCQKAIELTQKQQKLKEIRQLKRLKRLEAQPKKKRRVCANSFIAEEAAVSGSDESGDEAEYTTGQYMHDTCITSSDGEEHSGELPHTQMEAVYLQSINSPPRRRPGAFKIPEFRIFDDHEQIYSQAAPAVEDASQYALDSFVVNEHDDEQARMSKRRQRKATKEDNNDASLCPLERAEKLLKQERRLKRLKRRQLHVIESSDDDNDFE